MFCKNCGTQLKEGAAFCHQCGIMLGASQQSQAAQPMQPQAPISEVPPMPMPPADENSAPASAAEPEPAMPLNNEQAVPNEPSASQVYRMPPYAQPLQPTQKDNSGFAIASLILGILGVIPCCCANIVPAVLALIFGIIGLKSSKKGMAIAGIILSVIGLVFTVIIAISYIVGYSVMPYDYEIYNFDDYMYF